MPPLYVAPELRGLALTKKLCEAYDHCQHEWLGLHRELRRELSPRILVELFLLVGKFNSPFTQKLLPELKEKKPKAFAFVTSFRHAVWIENLLEGEITKSRLAERKSELLKGFLRGAPFEVQELLLKPYNRRPQHAPARKASLYLRALDFKVAHPRTTWTQLAKQFGADPNTLKTWSYRKKKELAEIGIQVRLETRTRRRVIGHE